VAECRKAIELDPKDGEAHYYLGLALRKQGKLDEADPEIRKAIELDPTSAIAHYWNTIGAVHYRAGNWKEAIAALERSVELLQGGDSFDRFYLAMAHWQVGEKGKARKWFDAAVQWMDKNQPKSEELRRLRAEAEGLLMTNHKDTKHPKVKP
jgi:superkiller protein 3